MKKSVLAKRRSLAIAAIAAKQAAIAADMGISFDGLSMRSNRDTEVRDLFALEHSVELLTLIAAQAAIAAEGSGSGESDSLDEDFPSRDDLDANGTNTYGQVAALTFTALADVVGTADAPAVRTALEEAGYIVSVTPLPSGFPSLASLEAAGYTTLEAVAVLTEAALTAIAGIGAVTATAIRSALTTRGYTPI